MANVQVETRNQQRILSWSTSTFAKQNHFISIVVDLLNRWYLRWTIGRWRYCRWFVWKDWTQRE